MNRYLTASELINLYKTVKSKSPIYYAAEHGEIPQADKIQRGKIKVRKWKRSDLPLIGKKFGFLKKPPAQKIISIYTPKGGVAKTTTAANLAIALAINNIKTLVCGLDFQLSITKYLSRDLEFEILDEKISTLNSDKNELGLYHLLFEGANISEVIQQTELPTLDIIPETPDLNFMTKKMRVENRREYIFKEKIIPKLKNYDVIIFDCNPGWTDLTENALVCCDTLLMPIACEAECYTALESNLSQIADFQNIMRLHWENYYLLPTLLERNSVSQSIYAKYISMYEDSIIPSPVKRSVIAQDARMEKISIMEYSPKSDLATEYYNLIKTLWKNINTLEILESA